MKFNKNNLEQIPIPASGYKIYRDEKFTGFCLRVSSKGNKTFIIDKKINKKLYRCTIGNFGVLTLEQARAEAQKILGQLSIGIDPKKEQKTDSHPKSITLIQAFNDYLAARKSLAARTISDYEKLMRSKFRDWYCIPLSSISKEMITKRHSAIGKTSPISANNAMKLVGALFNFAMYEYDDESGNSSITQNPVMKLSKTRAWYPTKRRRTKIETHQLAGWFKAVQSLKKDRSTSIANTVKDYLILLLFTGLRREEGMKLIWAEKKSSNPKITKTQSVIDLKAKTLLVRDTKNRQDHLLPLPDYLVALLKKRREENPSMYVFPNSKGNKHIIEPKKQINKVRELSGVHFNLHDLRRTFISIAESLDVPAYALKRLLNHKIINSDVTAGYIISDVERLKEPMQKIANFILNAISCSEETAEKN